MHALGECAQLAITLREHIVGLTELGRPPIAPHRPGFDPTAWRFLAAYLIEERRLTEFLLGPVINKKDGVLRYSYPNDICLDCFTSPDLRWRFPDQTVRKELDDRAGRINVRLAHFSWTLAEPDTRADAGVWNTHYLDRIVAGLFQFAAYLETIGSPDLANALRYPMLMPDGSSSVGGDVSPTTSG